MKQKIRIVFNRRKTATNRDSSSPARGSVEIEISEEGKRRWISTGVRIFSDQWKDGFVINHIDAADMNNRIRNVYGKIAMKLGNGLSSSEAIDEIQMAGKGFCDWMEEQILNRTDIAPNTKRDHLRTADYIRTFGLICTFKDLTERNITLWDQWLKQRLSKQSAVHGYHKRLKTYISRAMHLGFLKESPYRFVKISRGKSDKIRFITAEERERIEALNLSGAMAIARDMFIFSCYTGLAYCDLIRVRECLKNENGKMIIDGSRLKTGTNYKLAILPRAMEILERYNFDLNLLSNQKCNMYLKAVQSMAAIDTTLSMHVGRHTFATWALTRGVSLPVVSKMLAHTNIATTQIYAKVLQTEVTKGFEILAATV